MSWYRLKSMTYLKFVISCVATAALIGLLASCGEAPPVSIKDGNPISEIDKSTVDSWTKQAQKDVVKQCDQRGGSRASRQRCVRQGNQLVKEQILTGLIGDAWVQNEAQATGVKITAADEKKIEKAASDSLKQSGSKGFPKANVLARARAEFLLTKMVAAEIKAKKITVSDSQARRQYQQNKKSFNRPETLDVIFVTSKDKAIAREVAQQIRKGNDVNKVLDDLGAPKDQNPELKGITKSDVPKQAQFLFSLPKGQVYGAKEIDGAWVVAKVTKIVPAKQLTFAEVKNDLKQRGRQQIAAQRIRQEIQNIWRPRTECAEGYNSPLCSNRPAAPQQQFGR